jgi:hypothetical protein
MKNKTLKEIIIIFKMSENNNVTSLSSPAELKDTNYKPNQDVPPLTGDDAKHAVADLSSSQFLQKYPKVERYYSDPQYRDQVYSLHSFLPAAGATPDKDGIYGMIKIRGVFSNQQEMDQRAEWLIRNVDSYHRIYHGYVGRPMPACDSSKFSAEETEIDISKKTAEVASENIKQKRDQEQRIKKEIKEREEMLLEESKKEHTDPVERYTELAVKKAHLTWLYLRTDEQMKQMKESIIKARQELKELDETNPECRQQHYDKYMNARRESGLPDDDDSFVKYLVEDADEKLGF